MNRPTPSPRLDPVEQPPSPSQPERAGSKTLLIAAVLGTVVLAISILALRRGMNDDDDVTADTSTTLAPTTTEAPTTTAAPRTTVTPPPVDTSTAVFPSTSGIVRYNDPVAAARDFAVDFVGFTDPLVGELMQGDARSGEVQIRPATDGPLTTVFVRQLGPDDSWWVLGSATGNVTTDQPQPGATISSPVTVSGEALAFEGTVFVTVRQDAGTEPIGEGVVTGGGGPAAPFQGEIEFSAPTADYGALLFLTRSEMDGRVWEAAVFRVRFA